MAMIPTEELKMLHESVCTAVGETRRIQILYALHNAPQNVSTLAEILQTSQPTISRHLSILRKSGMVTAERDGSAMIYSLSEPRIIDIIDQMRTILRDILSKQVDSLDDE